MKILVHIRWLPLAALQLWPQLGAESASNTLSNATKSVAGGVTIGSNGSLAPLIRSNTRCPQTSPATLDPVKPSNRLYRVRDFSLVTFRTNLT